MALPFAVVGCVLHQLARSIGEATILGYLKALPQELIVSFGTGSGVATFFYMFIALLLQEMSIWKHASFLILALLVIPYFHFFAWMEDNRLFHKQFRNIFQVDKTTMEVQTRLQHT